VKLKRKKSSIDIRYQLPSIICYACACNINY